MAEDKIDLSLQEILARQGANGKGHEDPTENVKALVREVVIRIDALRESERRRSDDIREADRRHITEIMALRASYGEKLEVAEAKRIDAIRAVDVGAVAIATQRAADQAAVLAAQVQASAETLRVQLQQTAAIFKQQLDEAMSRLSDRVSSVERFQYEGKGSAGSMSPAVAEMLSQLQTQIAALKESRDRSEGKAGLSAPLLMLITGAVVGLVVFVLQNLMGGT